MSDHKLKWVSLNPDMTVEELKGYSPYEGSNNTSLPGVAGVDAAWEQDLGIRYIGRDYNVTNPWDSKRMNKTCFREIVADFYTLEAISCLALLNDDLARPRIKSYKDRNLITTLAEDHGLRPSGDGLENLAVRALIMQSRLAHVAAPVVSDYMHLAIAGELQYHPGFWFLSRDAGTSWWYLKDLHGGEQVARWASRMYHQEGKKYGSTDDGNIWASSFGGPAWGGAADVLAAYHNGRMEGMSFGDREFLDRAFSLQHNTGTLFNKVSWGREGLSYVQEVLNAHHHGTWEVLVYHASDHVTEMVRAYLHHLNNERRDAGMDSVGLDVAPMACYDDKSGEVTIDNRVPFVVDIEDLPAVKIGYVHLDTKCKISGKTISRLDKAVYHGKGKGFSLYNEYVKHI